MYLREKSNDVEYTVPLGDDGVRFRKNKLI